MGYYGVTFTFTVLFTDASDPNVLHGKPDDPYL